MCGIAVAINWEGAEAVVKSMMPGIVHRGDVTDPVVSLVKNTALCTRRLRIVDGDHGIQPQFSFDGRIAVAFNGEIYNYRELRKELEALHVTFRTDSDTEVLANSILAWGVDAMERFIGMFAFVAIEVATGEFIAARDPLGVKPLYYLQSGLGLLFCSEIKPLLAATETGDVGLVPPGCIVTRRYAGPYKSRLRPAASPPVPGDLRDLDRLLSEAVGTRIPEDLPVASILSGGIDSTLVTHYARLHRPEIPGYFIGNTKAADYPFVMEYAEKTGLDLRRIDIDPAGDEFYSHLDTVIDTVETFEPGIVRAAICSYRLGREIHKDGYRVALCGDGADELFCGYLPLELVFAESGDALGRPVRNQYLAHLHRGELQRVDRCTMAHQIETRVPFLDPAIVNFGQNLGVEDLVTMKNGQPVGKAILRRLFDLYPDQLPVSIRDRRKIPFSEGAGLGTLSADKGSSPFSDRAEAAVSDRDFLEGQARFAAYDIHSKEELLYLEKLAGKMDISRVPHMRFRPRVVYPDLRDKSMLKDYVLLDRAHH